MASSASTMLLAGLGNDARPAPASDAGAASLPLGVAVEIEAIFSLK